jgi:hypothetical protein
MSFALAHQNKRNNSRDSKTSTPSKHTSSTPHLIDNSAIDSHDVITHLQRAIGNQAVQWLIRSKSEEFDFSKIVVLQPKLKVSQPGDEYEQEADRFAEQVMRMSISSDLVMPKGSTKDDGMINRKCDACEMKEKKEEEDEEKQLIISRKPSTKSSPEPHNEISNVQSTGSSSLDPHTKDFMQSRFGYDFSNVRIHNDQMAARSAQSLNATAYTIGNDIVFDKGQYKPNTLEGRRLLAHELTHVIQQSDTSTTTATIRRQEGMTSPESPASTTAPEGPPPTLSGPASDYDQAISAKEKDYERIARDLNAFNRDDMIPRLGRLSRGVKAAIHEAAINSKDLGAESEIAIQTRVPWLDLNYENALNSNRYGEAAYYLNAFNREDILSRLAKLTIIQIYALRVHAVLTRDVGITSQVAELTFDELLSRLFSIPQEPDTGGEPPDAGVEPRDAGVIAGVPESDAGVALDDPRNESSSSGSSISTKLLNFYHGTSWKIAKSIPNNVRPIGGGDFAKGFYLHYDEEKGKALSRAVTWGIRIAELSKEEYAGVVGFDVNSNDYDNRKSGGKSIDFDLREINQPDYIQRQKEWIDFVTSHGREGVPTLNLRRNEWVHLRRKVPYNIIKGPFYRGVRAKKGRGEPAKGEFAPYNEGGQFPHQVLWANEGIALLNSNKVNKNLTQFDKKGNPQHPPKDDTTSSTPLDADRTDALYEQAQSNM